MNHTDSVFAPRLIAWMLLLLSSPGAWASPVVEVSNEPRMLEVGVEQVLSMPPNLAVSVMNEAEQWHVLLLERGEELCPEFTGILQASAITSESCGDAQFYVGAHHNAQEGEAVYVIKKGSPKAPQP